MKTDQSKLAGVDWATVDWSKTNRALGDELGATPQSIGYHRARLGKAKVKAGKEASRKGTIAAKSLASRLRMRKFDWATVDWSKGDTELGREIGITDVSVRYHRNRRAPRKFQSARSRKRLRALPRSKDTNGTSAPRASFPFCPMCGGPATYASASLADVSPFNFCPRCGTNLELLQRVFTAAQAITGAKP